MHSTQSPILQEIEKVEFILKVSIQKIFTFLQTNRNDFLQFAAKGNLRR